MSLLKSLILLFFYRVGIICTMKHSAFFVPFMSSENEASETQSSSIIINQMFHRCGMSESCSLVYEDRMSKKYGMAKNENDLPADTKNYNMWKKMQTGEGLKEDIKSKEPKTCKEALNRGINNNGIIDLSWGNGSNFKAFCDMKTNGGGWTVFQRRVDGNTSFERGWDEYVRGFGDLKGSFWLGLDTIHHLTKNRNVTLRIDLSNIKSMDGYAQYSEFTVKSKTTNYEINFSGYEGDVGDGMSMSKGMAFSTSDRDNDKFAEGSCAVAYRGAWWYNQCSLVRLNSLFPGEGATDNHVMKWNSWNEGNGTIEFSEIKLREEN